MDTNSVDNIVNKFKSLTSNQMKAVHRSTLTKVSQILVKETKANIRRNNAYKINSLQSAVRSKVNPDATEAKIHIMGVKNKANEYKLRFFEQGTKQRQTKKGYNRGNIKPLWFFKTAIDTNSKTVEQDIEKTLSSEINKRWQKGK